MFLQHKYLFYNDFCSRHGDCDHIVHFLHYKPQTHSVIFRTYCADCYKETKTGGKIAYKEWEFDSYEWLLFLQQLKTFLGNAN